MAPTTTSSASLSEVEPDRGNKGYSPTNVIIMFNDLFYQRS